MNFNKALHQIKFALTILVVLFVFMWSLDLMITTFKTFGHDTVVSFLSVTSNPFIGLFIGIFVTAIIQSSSTTTSLIVAIVATGNLSLENAIPIVMGANIGTTLTSTIVAISFITDKSEFKNAVAVGVVHDFFNILNVIILFPLEYNYHFLQNSATTIAGLFEFDQSDITGVNSYIGFIRTINTALVNWLDIKVIALIIAFAFLLGSIKFIANLVSNKMQGVANERLKGVIFNKGFGAFSLGAVFTSIVQSSSITTSIMVPFGAKGQIPIKNIFPFIVGANVGTTITAVIASISKSEAAISIAMVHLLFNLTGAIIFLMIPFIKELPVLSATKFGKLTADYKVVGLLYILLVFFIIPLALIYFS